MWQFLCRTAHVTSAYEQRQRNWALHVEAERSPYLEAAVRPPPLEAAVGAPPPPEAAVGAPPEAAVVARRPSPEIPSVPVRPTAETRPASSGVHPYYHQGNNNMYLNIT